MANRHRSEGFAFFLPVMGAIMIVPPIVNLFDNGGAIFGVPIIFAYLFGLWLFLIVASFVLSKFLPSAESDRHIERRDKDKAG